MQRFLPTNFSRDISAKLLNWSYCSSLNQLVPRGFPLAIPLAFAPLPAPLPGTVPPLPPLPRSIPPRLFIALLGLRAGAGVANLLAIRELGGFSMKLVSVVKKVSSPRSGLEGVFDGEVEGKVSAFF